MTLPDVSLSLRALARLLSYPDETLRSQPAISAGPEWATGVGRPVARVSYIPSCNSQTAMAAICAWVQAMIRLLLCG